MTGIYVSNSVALSGRPWHQIPWLTVKLFHGWALEQGGPVGFLAADSLFSHVTTAPACLSHSQAADSHFQRASVKISLNGAVKIIT